MSKKEKKKNKKLKNQKEKNPKKKKSKKEKIKVVETTLKLKIATKKDLLILDKYKKGGGKVWKFKEGVPYWLINSKGKIENHHYILTEDTNPQDVADWLIREQMLIPLEDV